MRDYSDHSKSGDDSKACMGTVTVATDVVLATATACRRRVALCAHD